MKAEEFYRLNKSGKNIENEYFIAMDKVSLYKLMNAYALHKHREWKSEESQDLIDEKVNQMTIIENN